MNVLHATTDPPPIDRLKQMMGNLARADIAVGYFFMSGFDAVADDFARLESWPVSEYGIVLRRGDGPALRACFCRVRSL